MRQSSTLLTLLLAVLTHTAALAQPANDECVDAINLGRVEEYCSAPGEFTNAGATASPAPRALCLPDSTGPDVWFLFEAAAPTVNIRVIGELARSSGGTLNFPEFVLYDASCTQPTELLCASDAFNSNVVEVIDDGLLPGSLYFLRVKARDGNTGTFQLCIETFEFVPDPQSDCVDGVVLCDKSPFVVQSLTTAGNVTDEVDASSCIREEFGSAWYRWTCDEPGTLELTLTPTNPTDDLDFIVYELPGGIDDCAGKEVARCMASGEQVGAPLSEWEPCTGATGLRAGDVDLEETAGCDPGDDNFAAPVDMVAGRAYALVVNNFSQSGNGFSITFGGTGTFLGPRPAFDFTPDAGSQCDLDEIVFRDASSLTPGSTGTREWFFGGFASPAQATGPGPHAVRYASFGEKQVTLRVSSSEGCVVSETRELFIEPCCEASEPLVAGEPDTDDPACAGTASGSFSVPVVSGEPEFLFSVDGGTYLRDSGLEGAFAGAYTVFLRNGKGCEDTVDVVLVDPPPVTVEAGDDRDAEFGDPLVLTAAALPAGEYTYVWTGADSVRCLDPACRQAEVIAARPGEIEVVATSPAGCLASDFLRLEVRQTRPLYVPNAFSPNGDLVNDRWTLYGRPDLIRGIRELQIFDRWGSMVWSGADLPIADPSVGWDGLVRGEPLNPGVFVFRAQVEYIDGAVLEVTGDINLVR